MLQLKFWANTFFLDSEPALAQHLILGLKHFMEAARTSSPQHKLIMSFYFQAFLFCCYRHCCWGWVRGGGQGLEQLWRYCQQL